MKVAVLWSGGKDSNLAYYRALKDGHKILAIATFIFDGGHPGKLLPLQAEALGVKHFTFHAKKPFITSHRRALSSLIEEEGIEGLVTGDIFLEHCRKWWENVCKPLHVKLLTPLWKTPAKEILSELVSEKFTPMITGVEKPLLGAEWLGRTIDKKTLSELERYCEEKGLDACGENGEFHTMMLDAPTFSKRIVIEKFSIGERNRKYAFLEPEKFYLEDKAGA